MTDLRYALRGLRLSPSFAAVAVLTLALGIGATTALFSVINAVLLRPLPYADPGRLVVLWESSSELGLPQMFTSPPNYADWRRAASFEEIAVFTAGDFTLTEGGEPERIQGTRVSATLLPLLNVRPSLGRWFLAEEDRPGGARVALLSHPLWRRRFAADSAILGKALSINGESHAVVGVMPEGFRFPPPVSLEGELPTAATDLWVPLAMDYSAGQRGAHHLTALGRLKPGVTLAAARSEMSTLAAGLARAHPDTNRGWGVELVPLDRQVTGELRPALLVLLGAAGLVLLLACANVANLLLARGLGRRQELAVRSALGAGRGRLARQLLAESLVLAGAGGLAGAVLALAGLELLLASAPANLPRLAEVSIDGRVLAFCAASSLAAGLLFALAPIVQVAESALGRDLRERGGDRSATATSLLRRGLVVAEVALALVVAVGAGLLAASFLRLTAVSPGFRAENVLVLSVALPRGGYGEPASRAAFAEDVVERLAALPGARRAGAINELPLAHDRQGTFFQVEGRGAPEPGQEAQTHFSFVAPGYFETLGVPLVQGRGLTAADRLGSRPVILVNEALARRYFRGEDPVGKRLVVGFDAGAPREIVGVVGDVRHTRLAAAAGPNVYGPYLQVPRAYQLTFVVACVARPETLAPAARQAVRAVDSSLAVFDLRTLGDVVASSVARERFSTSLLTAFSALALALAAVGIYGVVGYAASQRRREVGIRVALGARRADLLALLLAGAMKPAGLGILLGLAGACGLSRFLSGLLYEIRATDPATYLAVAAFFAVVALAAAALPAWWALQADPARVLGSE